MTNYKIEVFCDNGNNANTYLVYNDNSCFIIDPANNNKVLSKYIGEKTVLGILLTHGHYDHFKSLKNLLELYPTTVYMHKNAYTKLGDPNTSYAVMFGYPHPTNIDLQNVRFVKNDDVITLGEFTIKCWYTPGHTDCCMSYLLANDLFSGDFIFSGSIGRCDLATANMIRMSNSLNELKKRKDNYTIYPGHDSSTTLEEEKKYNRYLIENGLNHLFD